MKKSEIINGIRKKIERLESLFTKDLSHDLRAKIREDIEYFEQQIKEFNRIM